MALCNVSGRAPSQPSTANSGVKEEIPQLRKSNVPKDSEEIVRPTVGEAQHDYEIHRRLSHSHFYKAKTDTPNLSAKVTHKTTNHNSPDEQILKLTNQNTVPNSNSTNPVPEATDQSRLLANHIKHADEAYESANHSTGTRSSSSNGTYSTVSGDSLYGASSPGAESNYSSRHALKETMAAKAEADNMYPVYETVEPRSESQLESHSNFQQEKAPSDTFSNPPEPVFDQSDFNPPDPVLDQSNEFLHDSFDQSESMAAANEALNFLEELELSQDDHMPDDEEDEDDDDRRIPSPRSDISASSAATSRFGSYDISLDHSKSSGKASGLNSADSFNRRNPPRFIPPPPPEEPPPSDSDSPRYSEQSPRYSEHSSRLSEQSSRGYDQQLSDSDKESPMKAPIESQNYALRQLDSSEGINSLRAAKRTPRTALSPSLGLSIAPALEDYSLDDVNANLAPPPSFKDESPTKDKPFEPETFDFLNNYTKELGFPIRCTTPTRHKEIPLDNNSSFLHRNRDVYSPPNQPKRNAKPTINQFNRSGTSRDRSSLAVEVQPEEVSEFFEPSISETVPPGAWKVQVPKASKSLGEYILLRLPPSGFINSILTHTYPHKPLRKIEVTICNHQADSPLYVWPDI